MEQISCVQAWHLLMQEYGGSLLSEHQGTQLDTHLESCPLCRGALTTALMD